MAVTAEFYRDKWHGGFGGYVGSDEELNVLLSRASDIVNNAVFLSGFTVDTVPSQLDEQVKKAVCAQADYIDSSGGVEAMGESVATSVSLGGFSYSGSDGGASACTLCRQAESYLLPTGLLCRGVSVV